MQYPKNTEYLLKKKELHFAVYLLSTLKLNFSIKLFSTTTLVVMLTKHYVYYKRYKLADYAQLTGNQVKKLYNFMTKVDSPFLENRLFLEQDRKSTRLNSSHVA